MRNRYQFSRRAIFGLAVVPILPASTDLPSDDKLIGLSSQLDATMIALENEGDHDAAIRLLDRIEVIATEMIKIPANGIEGLRAKARATSWAIEHEFGMLDPSEGTSTNGKLAASIVRDLLSMRDGYFV